jgi:hypothetical protein
VKKMAKRKPTKADLEARALMRKNADNLRAIVEKREEERRAREQKSA